MTGQKATLTAQLIAPGIEWQGDVTDIPGAFRVGIFSQAEDDRVRSRGTGDQVRNRHSFIAYVLHKPLLE